MLVASFNQGFSLWAFVLLPLLIIAPVIMAIIEFRSWTRSFPLGKGSLIWLTLGVIFITSAIKPWHILAYIKDLSGFWLGWYFLALLTLAVAIPTLVWEAYKNEWLPQKWQKPKTKRKKKKRLVVEAE